MKFTCQSEDLSEALTAVGRALSGKPSIPILEGIKIKAEGSSVIISATDLELFIERKIKAEVKLEGSAVVVGKFFEEFCKKLVGIENIGLEKIDGRVTVSYGENESEIQCLSEDEFPKMPEVPDKNPGFGVKESDLKNILDGTLFSVALEDSRPILKGCLLELKEDTLTAVALDGYRLAVCKTKVVSGSGECRVIVPGKSLSEIGKIFEESGDTVNIRIENNVILFDLGHTKITARLIEGEYIRYEKIIPISYSTEIVLKKPAFEEGLDRASLLVRSKKNNYLKLSIASGGITIKSNAEFGSIREIIPCTLNGKELEIAFNSKYLFDALNRIKEDYIRVDFSGSNAPAVLIPTEGDKFKYIILPVRLLG
jgi:DNA polymerase III, beta subunit